ncbi:hypothetical protein Tco_0079184 [Tanacetum coccineum]
MPNPNLIMSNSPTISPFLKDSIVHIPYTNVKTFADDVLLNHVGDKELNLIDGVGNRVLTKKMTKKNDMSMPKEPNKELKLNEKAVPHNKEVYHYLWHPTKIPHYCASELSSCASSELGSELTLLEGSELDTSEYSSDTRPPMLDRTDFTSWQQCIRLYCRGKENGVNILKSIDEGPFQMGTFRETLAEGTEGALHLGPK